MNNLCNLAIKHGGSLTPLVIPSNLTDGLGLTNPSIIKVGDELIVNLRHVEYALYHSENEQKFQTMWGPLSYLNPEDDVKLRTTNYLCTLDPNTLAVDLFKKVDTSNLDVEPLWEFVGLEDARIVFWDDQLQLSGVRRDTTTNGEGRIELSVVEDSIEMSRSRIEPPTPSYCEKNWMPILDTPYHYVKWTNPTEVVRIINDTKTETVALVEQNNWSFKRDIRGGSQVINYGDYYVALTHEVDLFSSEQGKKDAQYYHRFIVWDKSWNIVAMSDEFKFMTARIEFSCGLVYIDGNFLITFGFQDSTAFVLKLPETLFETLVFSPKKVSSLLTKEKVVGVPSIQNKVLKFVNSPENAEASFDLAEWYFAHGHFASSMSFYLRAAEYSKNKDTTYKALIMVAQSLQKIGRRDTTELGLWLNAVSFAPERPEAYFAITKYYEFRQQYLNAYTYACMGLQYTDNANHISGNFEYNGETGFVFQKAVAAWWVGKASEARDLFFSLANNPELPKKYKESVQRNITSLGSGPNPFLRYARGYHENLKVKFSGSESIERNFSQTYQDMFVLTMLNGKRNGTYFEIGAADPFHGNNTALLETQFGWTGTSLEILTHEVAKFEKQRKNPVVLCDATQFDYRSKLIGHIDYLQIDCEPPATTYHILEQIPFDQCTFGVITFEHDYYADVTKSFREKSRNYLMSQGYLLVASNISPNDSCPYEDWWVHPKHVDKKILKQMLAADDSIKNAEKYMLIS